MAQQKAEGRGGMKRREREAEEVGEIKAGGTKSKKKWRDRKPGEREREKRKKRVTLHLKLVARQKSVGTRGLF